MKEHAKYSAAARRRVDQNRRTRSMSVKDIAFSGADAKGLGLLRLVPEYLKHK